jgi:glycosyltransferase involved in cell wall biosynthesis
MGALRERDGGGLPGGDRLKPLLFVTGHVPAYRAGALARLHEREGIEVALFGGRLAHGGPPAPAGDRFPVRAAGPASLARLAASRRYRAVICPTGGRAALLATWAGARAARVPLILWASLWAHPRSAAHALSYLPLRRLYRSADAVVTYGPHVSAYVAARGARNVQIAPQSVDNGFWSAPAGAPAAPGWPAQAAPLFLFVGRDAPGKGLGVLLQAWRRSGLGERGAALLLAGERGSAAPAGREPAGVHALGTLAPEQLRSVYAAADVLVVPSVPTATFREPWGLVVNEAMNRSVAVVASDAVGAAAGGLVRNGETGLVVAAGDSGALATAMERLAAEAELRGRLGEAGNRAIAAYTHEAWSDGFSRALGTVGLSRVRW